MATSTAAGRKHNWQSETMMDIGTGKVNLKIRISMLTCKQNYTEDHDIFREQARKFWKNIDPERVKQWDLNHQPDTEIWREAGEAGLLCIDTPAEYGGLGADFTHCCVASEEQAYAGPDFFGPGFGLHTG